MDVRLTLRDQIRLEMTVLIAIYPEDDEHHWIKGEVSSILSDNESICKNGVRVRISDGTIGHIKKIFDFDDIDSNKILQLIAGGETKTVEFKETFKVTNDTLEELKCLRDEIPKEIAAFMNADGGKLFIGVNDANAVTGLEFDYKFIIPERETQTKQDKLKQEIRAYVKSKLSDETLEDEYDIVIKTIGDQEICIIIVNSSSKPVFVDDKITYVRCNETKQTSAKRQLFFIRTDSGTQLLDPRKLLEFWKKKKLD